MKDEALELLVTSKKGMTGKLDRFALAAAALGAAMGVEETRTRLDLTKKKQEPNGQALIPEVVKTAAANSAATRDEAGDDEDDGLGT